MPTEWSQSQASDGRLRGRRNSTRRPAEDVLPRERGGCGTASRSSGWPMGSTGGLKSRRCHGSRLVPESLGAGEEAGGSCKTVAAVAAAPGGCCSTTCAFTPDIPNELLPANSSQCEAPAAPIGSLTIDAEKRGPSSGRVGLVQEFVLSGSCPEFVLRF